VIVEVIGKASVGAGQLPQVVDLVALGRQEAAVEGAKGNQGHQRNQEYLLSHDAAFLWRR
jgi:hypothetical protein